MERARRQNEPGTLLLARSDCWALALTMPDWIDLQVLSCNERAICPYQRAGFAHVDERTDMFRIDDHSVDYLSISKRLART